ncbi:hypothetical protein [Paenibacillus sp. Y412MC10]|uniref:hypothetical protein n=1 Tax=Geobacillus sp. (strain Y412MC10) TaxID=481743 RepID=UPI0011AB793B|nr:hypothetical protein [Paenibacillus sp. Y412MC10]
MNNKPNFKLSLWIFRCLGLAIVAYPVLYIVQKLTPGTHVFSAYNKYISHSLEYAGNHKTLVFALIVTLLFTASKRMYGNVAAEIRKRHLDLEVERWNETPYIAPLHLYHMYFPPQSYINTAWAKSRDFSYRYVTDHFRNRIYNRVQYTTFEAPDRPSLFKIVGSKIIAEVFGYWLAFMASFIILSHFHQVTQWYTDLAVYAIPVQVFLLRRFYYLIKAIFASGATYKQVDRFFEGYFGEKEPHLKWNELFPNQKIGSVILDVWKKECEDRQRTYDKTLNRSTQGNLIFDCPALPSKPFTAEHIPEWAERADEHYEVTKEQWEDEQRASLSPQPKPAHNPKVVSLAQVKRKKI